METVLDRGFAITWRCICKITKLNVGPLLRIQKCPITEVTTGTLLPENNILCNVERIIYTDLLNIRIKFKLVPVANKAFHTGAPSYTLQNSVSLICSGRYFAIMLFRQPAYSWLCSGFLLVPAHSMLQQRRSEFISFFLQSFIPKP